MTASILVATLNEMSFFTLLFRITGLFAARTAVAVGLGFFLIYRTQVGRLRKIYKMPYRENQLVTEFFALLKSVPFYSAIVTVIYYFKLIKLTDGSLLGDLTTIVALFIWNEIWFYGVHRVLHHPKLMFIHRDHHHSPVASPMSITHFSLTEQGLDIAIALTWPIIMSHFAPITLEGLTIYSVFQITVNVLAHSNIEVYPAGFAKSKIGQWFSSPTFHMLHHGRVRGHYGLMTTIPDRLFGTYFVDYPLVQERAAQGNGLTRASERVIRPPAIVGPQASAGNRGLAETSQCVS